MKTAHCDTCTCGLTKVEWSDREGWVDLADPENVAEVILNCALDHYYDRTHDGIPYGIPDKTREALALVVAIHLSEVEPNWQNVTVYSYDKEEWRERFKKALIASYQESTKV